MAPYDSEILSKIAASVEVDTRDLKRFASKFEQAARWYRLDRCAPKRLAPSLSTAKLNSIRGHADKLLKALGVESADAADDGPSSDIVDALVLIIEVDSAPIIEATRRLARLAQILDGIAAVRELSERAKQAAQETTQLGKLTVEKGNSGDWAVNDWIAAMMILYKEITGENPKTSVGKTGAMNEGVATGPLIRFLQAAGKPLDIQFSEDAWRSRVRTILDAAPTQNPE